jgi:uncharacterized protein YkwD
LSGRTLFAVCCALAVLVSPASASVSLPDVPALVPGLPGVEQLQGQAPSLATAIGTEPAMVAEVNRVRASRGLRPMRYCTSLRRSAGSYARWMLRAGYFGHPARIRASRRFRRLGEALAMHTGSRALIRQTVQRWLGSPPHRRLVLAHAFRHLGAGRALGSFRGRLSTTWVLHFGS